MRVFLISIDAAGRRRGMDACRRAGLSCTPVDGVNGKRIPPDALNTAAYPVHPVCASLCTPAMIGIALAHRRVWQRIVDEDLDMALVLEDDVEFAGGFRDAMRRAVRAAPPSFHVLLLGCFMCPSRRTARGVRKTIAFGGTHAYVVTREGARVLLASIPRAAFHLDVHMSLLPALRIYQASPLLAFQRGNESATAAYGFPRAIPWYCMHASFMRLGPYRCHVQVTGWHVVMLLCGVAGVSWELVVGAMAADSMLARVFDPDDIAQKLACYGIGALIASTAGWRRWIP